MEDKYMKKKKKTLMKLLGAAFAIAIYWLGFFTGMYCTNANHDIAETIELSDEELIDLYIQSVYGEGYYAVLFGHNDNGYINYELYSEGGDLENICVTSRGYLRKKFK